MAVGWIPPDDFLALSLADRQKLIDAFRKQAESLPNGV